MVVILLLALHVALVLGNETMPLQDQQLRGSGGYGCSYPWTSVPGLSSDCFYFVNDRKSWDSARSHCRGWTGGDLAILDTETKRKFVVDYMDSRGLRNGRSRHLGANDRNGYWRWLNGRSISSGWRRWKDGRADYEPDDDSGDDTCMYLYTDPYPAGRYDLLSDYKCTTGRYFLCEKRATDINECLSKNGGCQHTCTNTVGSFRCSCRSGYTLNNDWKSCSDKNECRTNNGGCKHNCINTLGSLRCSCRSGYLLSSDKKSCNDIDECQSNNGGCNQTCTNTDGSYTCSCSDGYTLGDDNNSCNDIDECSTNNGGCNQTCTNTDGSFTCSCSDGYTFGDDNKACHATSPTTLLTTVTPTAKSPECNPTRRCKKAKGTCQIGSECSGRKIKNGCKGSKGCICCIVDDKCTTNKKFQKKCTKRGGVCQSSPNCADGRVVVAKGCKGKCTCCARDLTT